MLTQIFFNLTDKDIDFITNIVATNASSKERVKRNLLENELFRNNVIASDKVFEKVVDNPEIISTISPKLLFEIFLRRTKKEFEKRIWTFERIGSQKVAVFDLSKAESFLRDASILEYLSNMLCSFTKIESFTIPIKVKKGIWHKIRFNDTNIDDLVKMIKFADEELKFYLFKRIADVCLFIMGIFPEYVLFNHRYTNSGNLRLKFAGKFRRSASEYEFNAAKYYKLASSHEKSYNLNMTDVFLKLSDNFHLARKILDFTTIHYLHLTKHSFFNL